MLAGLWVAPVALVLAAAVLRFRGLDAQSLWLDEAMSVYFINLGLDRLWEITFVREPNPPLYYLLLLGWTEVWGQGEIAVRSLSAVLGCLCVLPAFALARDIGGTRVGLLAGLATAASPYLLWYSQEARAFALLAITSATLLWLTHRSTHSGAGRWLWLWVLVSILTLYSHVYGAFAFGAAALVVLIYGRSLLGARVAAIAAPSLLFAPWVIATLLQSVAARGWRAPVGPDELLFRSLTTVAHHDVLLGTPAVAATAAVSTLAALGLANAAPRSRLLLGLAIVVPLAAAYALSFFKPIFAERYIIPIAVPTYVAAALGVGLVGRKLPIFLPAGAVAVVVLLATALTAFAEPRFEKENFRAAAARVAQSAAEDDVILFVAEFVQHPFAYYYRGPGRLVGFFGDHRNPGPFLEPVLKDAGVVWLVESHTERYDPNHDVRRWLEERYPLATEAYPQGINLRAFRAAYAPLPRCGEQPQAGGGETVRAICESTERATFAELTLVAAGYPDRIAARDRSLHPPSAWLPVHLVWRPADRPQDNYRLILELVDARGVWGRSLERPNDLFSLVPTSNWSAGQVMVESVDVNLNPDTPPGRYALQLSVLDAGGNPVPSTAGGPVHLGDVEVIS